MRAPQRREHADSWLALADWWLEESRDPTYQEEVIPLFLAVIPQAVEGQVLLDLGCGDGRIQDLMVFRGAKAVGVDMNLDLLRLAGSRHPVVLNYLPQMFCIRDCSVDGAYVVLSLEHFEDSRRLFSEAARVTRTGGWLVIVINHPVYTAPRSGPVLDTTDDELLWRFGDYLTEGRTRDPAGGRTVEFIHRPIWMMLTEAAAAGWSLEVVKEQGTGPLAAARDPILAKHGDIPHLMALRWRRLESAEPGR